MDRYSIPLVPGPTSVPSDVLAAYQVDYASADLEEDFCQLYAAVQDQLHQILGTQNQVAIMSGEAMVVLWGALRSCLRPRDPILAIATGVFGYGIGDMARAVGAEVEVVGFDYDVIADDIARVEAAIARYHPRIVTMVHCETPSGTLNPVEEVGKLVAGHDVPLFYVDAVSSAGGVPLETDAWHIDLCLVGTQKCLSAPPDLGIIAVSERAWEIVGEVGYAGYDALAPWRTALVDRWFPYTPSWHAMAGLHAACARLLAEGLDKVIQRHEQAASYCRQRIKKMGLSLYPREESFSSPTVTAIKVPEGLDWAELDRRLRVRGMGVGGSLGPLAGKVFRIGHMGTQADLQLLERGMDALEAALKESER
jgi:aspartate aminotransferase-like enzyme